MNFAQEEDYNKIPNKMVEKFIYANDGKSEKELSMKSYKKRTPEKFVV